MEQKKYLYSAPLTDIKSDEDIILNDQLVYILDINGTIKDSVPGEEYLNVFSDFKEVVPLVLAKPKR